MNISRFKIVQHIAVCAAIAAGLVGCSENTQGPDASTSAQAQGNNSDAYYRDYLDALRKNYRDMGLTSMPTDAGFVRYLDEDEFADVYAACMREYGFQATVSPDGGVSHGEIPAERAVDQLGAMYRCDARYPPKPPTAPAP